MLTAMLVILCAGEGAKDACGVCEGERMFHFRVVYGMKSIQLVRTRKNASFYLIKLSKCKDEGQWDNIDCFYIEFFSFLHNLSALNNFA